jgi:hypothetical protein
MLVMASVDAMRIMTAGQFGIVALRLPNYLAIFSGSSRIRAGAFLTKTGKKDPRIAAF